MCSKHVEQVSKGTFEEALIARVDPSAASVTTGVSSFARLGRHWGADRRPSSHRARDRGTPGSC